MILAEKGLPRSGAVGNELFDKLGSLGLTSFMQDVTRLRALEGELARTIQMMRTVKAARVHIVLADEGSFRRERQPPSASVVIRTDGGDDRATGQAIRHLVAAAVPGMKVDDVTVLNVDGRLLASGTNSIEKSPDNLLALEKEVSQEIRENVTRTLTPYLSARNFQVSVAARLNADKTQTNETIYNPDERVERSVRVTKEQQSSQNAAGQQAAGVEANLPKPTTSERRIEAVERSDAEARGTDELRGLVEVDPDDERGLRDPEPVGRGADQPRRAHRLARRQADARRRSPPRSTKSSSSSRRPPASTGNAATRSRSRSSTSSIRPRPRAGARPLADRDSRRVRRARSSTPAPSSRSRRWWSWFGVRPALKIALAPRAAEIGAARGASAGRDAGAGAA